MAPPLDMTDLVVSGGQLERLFLDGSGFDGASIVFTVSKKPGGDGLAHVGAIFASVDLDKVIVKGRQRDDHERSRREPAPSAQHGGSTGTLLRCGAIVAGDDLGPVKIGGSITGNLDNPALIIAKGQDMKPTSGFDTAIDSLTVGGDVRFARILAGFNMDQAPANADASIGKVTVGADWVASSLLAGVEEAGFPAGYQVQTVGNTSLFARIASIVIKGDVTGTLVGNDSFGFIAQQIDRFKVGPNIVALTAGPGNDYHLFSGEVHLTELIWI